MVKIGLFYSKLDSWMTRGSTLGPKSRLKSIVPEYHRLASRWYRDRKNRIENAKYRRQVKRLSKQWIISYTWFTFWIPAARCSSKFVWGLRCRHSHRWLRLNRSITWTPEWIRPLSISRRIEFFAEFRNAMKAWIDDFNLHARTKKDLWIMDRFLEICRKRNILVSAKKSWVFCKGDQMSRKNYWQARIQVWRSRCWGTTEYVNNNHNCRTFSVHSQLPVDVHLNSRISPKDLAGKWYSRGGVQTSRKTK